MSHLRQRLDQAADPCDGEVDLARLHQRVEVRRRHAGQRRSAAVALVVVALLATTAALARPLTFDLEGWQALRKTPLVEDPVLPAWLIAPCRSTAWGVLPPAEPGAQTSNRDMRSIAHS